MGIGIFILKRLLYAIPTLLGTILIIFILFNVVSPDPALILLGKHASVGQIAEVRRELGLDRSYWVQYLEMVKSTVTFDFGRSWATKQDIMSMIKNGALPSLALSVPGFILSTIIGLIISLIVAFYRGKFIDRSSVFVCVFMTSISSLSYILFFQWFFAYELGWFEISGYVPEVTEILSYVALPIIIWIILNVGPDVRFFRTVILDEVYQDYVRTARAKGLGEITVFFKHVLKNAMIPIITYVLNQVPFLILGAILLESFFAIPGLGSLSINAINSSDFPVIRAVTILSSMGVIIFNALTDILYTVVDPRVRLQ